METNQPIIVNDGTAGASLGATLRYLLTAAGSFAIGKGWVTGETMQAITALVTVVAPTVWGIYRALSNKKKLIVAADAAPNSVARVV